MMLTCPRCAELNPAVNEWCEECGALLVYKPVSPRTEAGAGTGGFTAPASENTGLSDEPFEIEFTDDHAAADRILTGRDLKIFMYARRIEDLFPDWDLAKALRVARTIVTFGEEHAHRADMADMAWTTRAELDALPVVGQ